jgi:hypothetical protein
MASYCRESERGDAVFRKGELYSRREISDCLGGNPMSYLPSKGGRVLYACLRPELNPHAPKIVLVGSGEKTVENARMLCRQNGAIPVFVREADAEWEYMGDYEVERCSEDQGVIDEHQGYSGREDLRMIIYLKKHS